MLFRSIVPTKPWHAPLLHDASTTDGCSGGVVIAVGVNYQQTALGIHFGSPTSGRVNQAHALTDVLDQVSDSQPGVEAGTLRDILEAHQAQFSVVPFA